MMTRRADTRRDAPALRFLLLCVGGWIALRLLMVWNPAAPPPDAVKAPWTVPAPFAAADASPVSPRRTNWGDAVPATARVDGPPSLAGAGVFSSERVDAETRTPSVHGLGADRHSLRLALMARLLPPSPGGLARSAAATRGPVWFPGLSAERAEPGQGKPFWISRPMSGWSLASWIYVRDGDLAAPEGIAAASQLGGSQAGLRLGYGFGDNGSARAYARATIAMRRPEEREFAFGLAFAPLAHVPLDVAVEQRVAAGRQGRTALAAMISGGVSDVALPGGFRLDAYGQAGVVGTKRRDGFADGAVVVDHRIGKGDSPALRLGALAAGAIQPGAARVDVGPRLTLRLPEVGEGSRIALDWRQRVAGDARPESGLALTLAADF